MTIRPVLPVSGRLCRFVGIGAFLLALGTVAASAQDFRSSLVLSPYTVDFGEIAIGKTSDPQTVTLLNSGSAGGQVDKITLSGDGFRQTSNCPSSSVPLAKNQTCGIEVTFKPTAAGPATGTVSVFHDGNPDPLKVTLTGSGSLHASAVTFSPDSLDFGEQPVGTSSKPQTLTMSNTGQKTLLVTAVNSDGDFTIMPGSTCETLQGSLEAGSNCTLLVTFSPLGPGKREGHLIFTDDAAGSPQKVALTGTGKQ